MMLESPTDKIQLHVEEGVATLVYNNPDRHNALSIEMQRAVAALLPQLDAEDSVRVLVLRGAGERSFISGADLRELPDRTRGSDARKAWEEAWGDVSRAFAGFEKPIVAAIRGYCIGGGLATALEADLRLATADSTFAIPAARLGVGYSVAGVEKLVSIVGATAAAEILLVAQRIDAATALRVGLLNRVVAQSDFDDEVASVTRRLADNAPLTVRAAKFAVRQSLLDPAQRDRDRAQALVALCSGSRDLEEGRRAFTEGRRPRFQGS